MWHVYPNTLSQELVDELLTMMKPGLSAATVRVHDQAGTRQSLPMVRNNMDSYTITEQMRQTVLDCIANKLAGEHSIRFDYERFGRIRMYGYQPAMKFSPHIDGAEPSADGYENVFTVLIYLQCALQGGETVLYNVRTRDGVRIDKNARLVPEVKIGDMLVFDRRFWHEGAAVVQGEKYVLRTDLQQRRLTT